MKNLIDQPTDKKPEPARAGTTCWPRQEGPMSSEDLLSVMYENLRNLAAIKMHRESGFQTLQPTALVHEAWLRINPGGSNSSQWNSDAHFLGAAAEAMKRVLVDRARARKALKRTANYEYPNNESVYDDHILRIHEGLKKLEMEDREAADLVSLKFFSGFTTEEIATAKRTNVRAVERQWTFAKARLYQIISADLGDR